MFCENCGKEITGNIKFCPCCGSPVKDDAKNVSGDMTERTDGMPEGIPENIRENPEPRLNGVSGNFGKNNPAKPGKKKAFIIGIAAVLILVFIFTGRSSDKTLKFNLHVVNNTGIDIYSLYASETDVYDWEEDLLGDDMLFAGESVNIIFTLNKDNMIWDFAMQDVNGNMVEFYNLNFADCDASGATLVLEYDGFGGTATLY